MVKQVYVGDGNLRVLNMCDNYEALDKQGI